MSDSIDDVAFSLVYPLWMVCRRDLGVGGMLTAKSVLGDVVFGLIFSDEDLHPQKRETFGLAVPRCHQAGFPLPRLGPQDYGNLNLSMLATLCFVVLSPEIGVRQDCLNLVCRNHSLAP